MRAMGEEVAAFKDTVEATALKATEAKARVGAEVRGWKRRDRRACGCNMGMHDSLVN